MERQCAQKELFNDRSREDTEKQQGHHFLHKSCFLFSPYIEIFLE